MLDVLLPLKNEELDIITFFSTDDETIRVEGHNYKDFGESLDTSTMGLMYHIVLVKDHMEDAKKYDQFDQFEAILVSPLDYISRMINEGWYGVVAKKTTTSQKFVEKLVANIKNML